MNRKTVLLAGLESEALMEKIAPVMPEIDFCSCLKIESIGQNLSSPDLVLAESAEWLTAPLKPKFGFHIVKTAFLWHQGVFRANPPGWDFMISVLKDLMQRSWSGLPSRTAIVLDDDLSIGKVLCHLFEKFGMRAETFACRDLGLARCLEQKPDLLLLDVKMPGLDWLSCAKQVKSANPQTEVYLVTGERQVRGADAVDGVLYKPFGLEKIVCLLQEVFFEKGTA